MPSSHSGIATGLRPVPFGPPGSIPGDGVFGNCSSVVGEINKITLND